MDVLDHKAAQKNDFNRNTDLIIKISECKHDHMSTES